MKIRILITVMAFTMLFGLFGCGAGSKKTVTSVENMTITLRTMRGGCVYKFEVEGDAAELRRYRETYRGGKEELVLEAGVPCGMQEMIELMNTCGILRWNGFHGKHPGNVKDGTMFIFTATVNGTQEIFADGSENFPKGYREFVRSLDSMLAENEVTE